MDESTTRCSATILAVLVVALMAGGATLVAATGTVAADQHGREDAPTYNTSDGDVEFVVNLPDRTDHYPGDSSVHSDQNGYNASIEYFASVQAPLTEEGAEEGLWLDFLAVEADWIDYSQCGAGNTKAFGIDRGNDNDGTRSDESLLEHRKGTEFKSDGLDVIFYDWGDLANDPPYVAPEDAVVAAQGAGSEDGPCLKMTSEPGWYQVQAYTNGTIATKCTEEGNSECEPDDKQWRGLNLNSNWVYVCECDSEQEAREELGPPPNEEASSSGDGGGDEGGDESTPTPTPAPDTPTPTAQSEATPQQPSTPTRTQAGGDQNDQQNQQQQNDQQSQQQQNDQQNQQQQNDQQSQQQQGQQQNPQNREQGDRATPTIGDGPGFTPVAALVALVVASRFVSRRR